ncbi:MAG: LysR family transcriptional regulator [Eubacteriales bacterium]|nr:LysR family transcriptional regulator [Eubacteriales bacterium]
MDVRSLKYFIAVVEEKSYSRAATRLCMSQPPLSRMVKQLEEELHTELFKRNTRHLELTDAGYLLYMRAHDLVELLAHTEKEVVELGNGCRGIVNIGTLMSLGKTLLPTLLAPFSKEYPEISYHIEEGRTVNIADWIEKGICDIGFIRFPINEEQFCCKVIGEEKLAAVFHKDHPLARREGTSVLMEEIKGERFILSKKIGNSLQEYYHRQNHEIHIICSCSDFGLTASYVAEGMGTAVCPATEQNGADNLDVVYKTIEDAPFTSTMAVIWRKERCLNGASKSFLNYVLEQLEGNLTVRI